MFFAFFLKLYSSSSYDKGQGIFAILRYMYIVWDLPLLAISEVSYLHPVRAHEPMDRCQILSGSL